VLPHACGALQMKEIAPDTKIWVYRNLAQAHSRDEGNGAIPCF
jgi:hypothetical protein